MRVDTKTVLRDYDGKELTFQDIEGTTVNVLPLDLRTCFTRALNSLAVNPETNMQEVQTAETKQKIYGLSVKLYQNSEINLTPDDMVFLRDRVGRIWNAIVYGRICELFDGTSPDETPSGESATN